jgi:phosphatidylethanolamine-binding protein (PEBP) family uncharacterized protein
MRSRLLLAVCLGLALAGAEAKKKKKARQEPPSPPPQPTGPFALTASSFRAGGTLPPDNRGDEDDVSPHLRWENAPVGTETFVLIADETDAEAAASARTNWIVYDIPSEVAEVSEELSGGGSSDVARLGLKVGTPEGPARAGMQGRGRVLGG